MNPSASATSSEAPTHAEIVERAASLRPLLDEEAFNNERERHLVDRVADAITEAGLPRLMAPKRLGGYETNARNLVDVTRELGKGCASTGWVVGILNAAAWMTGIFPEEAQNDVWGNDPSARLAGVLAPSATTRKVDGGIVISGKWPWASGSMHSEWVIAAGPVAKDDGTPETHIVILPRAEIEIEDTWFVAGMRGTGSNTVVADEVFVPHHRMMSLPAAIRGDYRTERTEETLYRSSFFGILAVAIAGPQLGMAEAALEYVLEKAPKRAITSTTYTAQTDSVGFQITVAEAAAKIDTAKFHTYRCAEEIDLAAATGSQPEVATRARWRMDLSWSSQQLREAINLLLTAHGTSAFAEVSPLQRIWRDQEVASRHAIVAPNVAKEIYGRDMVGAEQITLLL